MNVIGAHSGGDEFSELLILLCSHIRRNGFVKMDRRHRHLHVNMTAAITEQSEAYVHSNYCDAWIRMSNK